MSKDPWDKKYLYYANEDPIRNSIMQWNTETMELDAEIEVGGTNPHSVDRACYTDKMYVRTQNSFSFDVIDVREGRYIKSVDLPFHPRTCGDQNYKYNLQLVGGKDATGVALIDVEDDTVIFTDWEEARDRGAEGNQGGSASGHAVWFDDDHFGYLNRIESEIKIFKVYPSVSRKWKVRYVQRLATRTAMHTIQDDKIDVGLTEKHLYGTVEGDSSRNIKPGIQKFIWNGSRLSASTYKELPNTTRDDTIHHYSISSGGYLWIPTFKSRKTHLLRLSDMRWVKTYNSGYGGGHVNFSYKHQVAIVTNHFDDHITFLHFGSTKTTNVKVNNDPPGYPPKVGLMQTHSNWISEDENYFYFGNSHSGELVEVDIAGKYVSRKLFVGGHPEQSIS